MVTVMRSSDDVVSLFLNGALDSTHVGFNSAHLTDLSHPLTLGCRTEAQSSYAQSSHAFRDGAHLVSCPSSLNVLKDTYDYSCYLAHSDEYRHLMTDSPTAM